ncbi:MAG: hypothetical protein WCO82_09135 [Sphingomonadales bacterium]|jgi:hypothetical protein
MNKLVVMAMLMGMPTIALAQQAGQPATAGSAMRQIVVSPNTEVMVTPNDNITTKGKQVKQGFKFRISTVFDVMQDGFVVIPKGTPGEGTVTWMTNKGAFGKSGKMEVSFDWLELGGRRIALTGTHRQEGEGNTGATVGAVVAVGVFSAFVTGRSATIVNGQQLRARTAEPLTFSIPANAPQVVTGTLTSAPIAAQAPTPLASPVAPAGQPGTQQPPAAITPTDAEKKKPGA